MYCSSCFISIKTGLLKWCSWKGARLNCSSIFSMFPTDRGMCCSFNMERAETMFRESQYRERIDSLTRRDKGLTFDSSAVPGWFEPIPESGQHRGLTLMLDAHNDKVASSTVPDDFEVMLFLKLANLVRLTSCYVHSAKGNKAGSLYGSSA